MAHYAFLDENNIVIEIIKGVDENELIDGKTPEVWYGEFKGLTCKRTSFNTIANQHNNGGTPFRGNYATLGGSYDENLDVFIPPKHKDFLVLDEETLAWVNPIPCPGPEGEYSFNEGTMTWERIALFPEGEQPTESDEDLIVPPPTN